MTFICQMCGACCSTMGEIISIHEEHGDSVFTIWYTTTGEQRTVRIDPEKQGLYYENPRVSGMACPFLREIRPGTRICSVHASRPDLCRQYSCFRMLILAADGRRAGRVMDGTRLLSATDPALHDLWHRTCRALEIVDEEDWEREIEAILSNAGYRVIR